MVIPILRHKSLGAHAPLYYTVSRSASPLFCCFFSRQQKKFILVGRCSVGGFRVSPPRKSFSIFSPLFLSVFSGSFCFFFFPPYLLLPHALLIPTRSHFPDSNRVDTPFLHSRSCELFPIACLIMGPRTRLFFPKCPFHIVLNRTNPFLFGPRFSSLGTFSFL